MSGFNIPGTVEAYTEIIEVIENHSLNKCELLGIMCTLIDEVFKEKSVETAQYIAELVAESNESLGPFPDYDTKEPALTVWSKAPNEVPKQITINNELTDLQLAVGGYVELYAISEHIGILCNEDGKLLGLPVNCSIEGADFAGTILFVGLKDEEFCSCPWSEEEIKGYYPELFKEV